MLVGDLLFFGVSANTWDSLTNVMDWCRDQGANLFGVCNDAGDPIKPRVISVQETRLKVKGKLDSAYGWGDRRSFNFSLGPALSTGAGPTQSSAGVGFGVTSSLASSSVSRPPDLEYFKSRVVIRHVNVGLPGGLMVLSVYLYTSLGVTGENV